MAGQLALDVSRHGARPWLRPVQITMAEAFGVAGRGRFYDSVGAIRDVLQNHLLQILARLALEPPLGTSAEAIRDEQAKLLKAIRPLAQPAPAAERIRIKPGSPRARRQ